jgi:hypothetical protein
MHSSYPQRRGTLISLSFLALVGFSLSAIPAHSQAWAQNMDYCIAAFYDPNMYIWLGYKNSCGAAVAVMYISGDGHHEGMLHIAAGGHGSTGRSASEATNAGGFESYSCPEGYVPVDSDGRYVTRPQTVFRCKAE